MQYEQIARAMRRSDRQLPYEEAVQILEEAEYGILSVNGDEGVPYGVPLSFIWLDGAVYFHCAKEGYKTDCMQRDARASFSAVCDVQAVYDKNFTTFFRSVIISGRAVEVTDDGIKSRALAALCAKYLPDHAGEVQKAIDMSLKHTAVWKIEPDSVSAKGKRAAGE